FVREIVTVLFLEFLDALTHKWVSTGKEWICGEELVCKIDCIIDTRHDTAPFGTNYLGVLSHQVAHGRKGRPAGQRVVADIQNATHFELARDEIDDNCAVGIRYPAPDAVHADIV